MSIYVCVYDFWVLIWKFCTTFLRQKRGFCCLVNCQRYYTLQIFVTIMASWIRCSSVGFEVAESVLRSKVQMLLVIVWEFQLLQCRGWFLVRTSVWPLVCRAAELSWFTSSTWASEWRPYGRRISLIGTNNGLLDYI